MHPRSGWKEADGFVFCETFQFKVVVEEEAQTSSCREIYTVFLIQIGPTECGTGLELESAGKLEVPVSTGRC